MRLVLLGILAFSVTACASAGKRLEQGILAEESGDFHLAVARYTQALAKDETFFEARSGLLAAWDSAVARGTLHATDALASGRPLEAAGEFRRLEALRSGARAVKIELQVPERYPTLRRTSLDASIEQLLARADTLRAERRWDGARDAYREIMDDMEPAPDQRVRTLDAHREALLEWAGDESAQRRFRAAYERAGEALILSSDAPADVVERVGLLQEQALSSGLRVLAVFPVAMTEAVRRFSLTDLQGQISDILETEHWRRPPLFVAVADPASVRRITRAVSPPGTDLHPRRILAETGADFGALVTLMELEAEERNVRSSRRAARTTRGDTASYGVEEGRIHYTLVAEVTLFNDTGSPVESFRVRRSAADGFRRARYEGDVAALDLSRAERLLFNPGEERRARGLLQSSMLEELAGEIAEGLFRRTVRRIP